MKRLKYIVNRINKDERGLASFVIVGVLVILLTLISIGFAKLMDRAQNNSLNNQLSTAANYAAQSALKDTSSAIINQLQASPGSSIPGSTSCVPTDPTLKAVYDSGNLSNDTDQTAKYTCILVNPKPTSLDYQQVPADDSEVVKILPEFTNVKIQKIVFGWQSSAGTGNDQLPNPPGSGNLPLINQKQWNTNKYFPMLRITLYPIDNSNNILASSTFFAYPTNQNGAPTVSSANFSQNGATINARCGGTFNKLPPGQFSGNRDYTCNALIDNLASVNGGNVKYFYARVTPLYVNADFGIQANYSSDPGNGTVTVAFLDTQATVDVTAKDGTAIKRLQGKVDLTGVTASGSGSSNGVTAGNHDISEYSLQSATAICKRYEFISGFTAPTPTSQACQQLNNPINLPPPPTVTLAASPNSITSGSTTTLTWTIASTAPIANCKHISSGPVGVPEWDSSNASTSNGSQVATLNNAGSFKFTLVCTDVLGQSGSDNKTVNVTSPGVGGGSGPTVTLTANPNQVSVGGSSTLTWTVSNATSCTASNDSGGSWTGSVNPAGGSQSTGTLSSSKVYNYNIVCINTYGADTASAAVSTNGSPPPPPGGCTTGCSGGGATKGTIVVHVNIQRHSLTWDAVDNPGTDGDGLSQCDLNIGGPNYATQYINLFGYSGGGPGRLGQQSGSISGNYPTGTTAILICQAVDGAPPGTATSVVPVPPVQLQFAFVDGYQFWGSYGGSTCHDGLHPYILCVSWNAYQDDGIYHIGSYPPGDTGGVVANNCVLSYNGGSGRYTTTGQNTPSSPVLWEYWNRTMGWFSDPGVVNGSLTCTSDTYGNSTTTSWSWSNGFCYTQAGSGCNGTGAGGSSGGGSGGGGGGGGGGDGPPPPAGDCNSAPYAGGTYPNCYCLYPGGSWPNCPPPPGSGGGGCGLNIPGKTEMFPEFGFLSFVPYMGFVIC